MAVYERNLVVFGGTGLLLALRPSAAAGYPDSALDGQRLVRYVAASVLITLEMFLFLGITT